MNGEIRVYFMLCREDSLEFDLKWGKKPRAADRKALLQGVLAHRTELLLEWETKVASAEER